MRDINGIQTIHFLKRAASYSYGDRYCNLDLCIPAFLQTNDLYMLYIWIPAVNNIHDNIIAYIKKEIG